MFVYANSIYVGKCMIFSFCLGKNIKLNSDKIFYIYGSAVAYCIQIRIYNFNGVAIVMAK